MGSATYIANDSVIVTQDPSTGDVIITLANESTSETYSGVTAVIVNTPGVNNTIDVDPSVTVPVSVFAGSGSTVNGQVADEPELRLDGPPTITEGQIVSLTLQAAVSDGAISDWNIDWGDGNNETYTTDSPSHTYTTGSGVYTVSASADDTGGISETCPDSISVGVLPKAPTGLSAIADEETGGQIDLAWTNESALATGFQIEESTDATNYAVVSNVDSYTSSYMVSGLIASTTYHFRVCAVERRRFVNLRRGKRRDEQHSFRKRARKRRLLLRVS